MGKKPEKPRNPKKPIIACKKTSITSTGCVDERAIVHCSRKRRERLTGTTHKGAFERCHRPRHRAWPSGGRRLLMKSDGDPGNDGHRHLEASVAASCGVNGPKGCCRNRVARPLARVFRRATGPQPLASPSVSTADFRGVLRRCT